MLLVQPVNAGEKLLRLNGAVERLARAQAIVATVAREKSRGGSRGGGIGGTHCRRQARRYRRRRERFAEKFSQKRATGLPRFGVMHHLSQLLVRDFLLAPALLFNEPPLFNNVAGIEKEHAFARQTVASGAAGLLIIALDVLRQIIVNDEAHGRF